MPAIDDSTSLGVSPATLAVGWAEPIVVPDPAAGTVVVPHVVNGAYWERVLCGHITFTADATVGTRFPRFQILDGPGHVLYEANLSTGVVASTSVTASVGANGNISLAASGFTQAAIPDLILPAGYTFQFVSNVVGAADAFTGNTYLVGRYPSSAVRTGSAG